jgi:hypothetical protein
MTPNISKGRRVPALTFVTFLSLILVLGSPTSSANSLKIINSSGQPIGLVFDGLKPEHHTYPGVKSATLQPQLPQFLLVSGSANDNPLQTNSDRGRGEFRFKKVQGCGDCTGHYMEQVTRFCTVSCNYTWTQETGDVFEIGYEVCPPNPGCTCSNEYTCTNNGIH